MGRVTEHGRVLVNGAGDLGVVGVCIDMVAGGLKGKAVQTERW
jgi:hypothetical protein